MPLSLPPILLGWLIIVSGVAAAEGETAFEAPEVTFDPNHAFDAGPAQVPVPWAEVDVGPTVRSLALGQAFERAGVTFPHPVGCWLEWRLEDECRVLTLNLSTPVEKDGLEDSSTPEVARSNVTHHCAMPLPPTASSFDPPDAPGLPSGGTNAPALSTSASLRHLSPGACHEEAEVSREDGDVPRPAGGGDPGPATGAQLTFDGIMQGGVEGRILLPPVHGSPGHPAAIAGTGSSALDAPSEKTGPVSKARQSAHFFTPEEFPYGPPGPAEEPAVLPTGSTFKTTDVPSGGPPGTPAGTEAAWTVALLTGGTALTLLGTTLYHRIGSTRALDHKSRAVIVALLRANPGLPTNEIAERTGIPRKTLDYHLRVLSRGGHVGSTRENGRRLFWTQGSLPPGGLDARVVLERSSPTSALILSHVEAKPGISPAELAAVTALTTPLVAYHLKQLEERNLIRRVREGARVAVRLHRPDERERGGPC